MSTNQNCTYPFGPTFKTKHDLMGLRFMTDTGDGSGAGNTDSKPATDDELGEGGKKALAAERKRANDIQKQIEALTKAQKDNEDAELSELQRITKERDNLLAEQTRLSNENLRYRVATTTPDFPIHLASRLQGADEDALKADAAAIIEQFGGTKPVIPKADPSAGKKQSASGLSNAEQFAATIDDLFDKQ